MNSLIWIFGAVALLALAVFIFEYNYPRMRKVRPYVHGVPHKYDCSYPNEVQHMLVTHHSGIFTKRRHGKRFDDEDRAEKARMEMIERELQLGRIADELRDKIASARGQK